MQMQAAAVTALQARRRQGGSQRSGTPTAGADPGNRADRQVHRCAAHAGPCARAHTLRPALLLLSLLTLLIFHSNDHDVHAVSLERRRVVWRTPTLHQADRSAAATEVHG